MEKRNLVRKESIAAPHNLIQDSKPFGWGPTLGLSSSLPWPQEAWRCSSSREFPALGLFHPLTLPSFPWALGTPCLSLSVCPSPLNHPQTGAPCLHPPVCDTSCSQFPLWLTVTCSCRTLNSSIHSCISCSGCTSLIVL